MGASDILEWLEQRELLEMGVGGRGDNFGAPGVAGLRGAPGSGGRCDVAKFPKGIQLELPGHNA